MSTSEAGPRGVLDTSTVILLSRFEDATLLPAEPLITAVTLAELSVGPLGARGERERAGREPAARAYDAMIAATAIANDLPIYTCNPGDFAGVDDLTVVPLPIPPTS